MRDSAGWWWLRTIATFLVHVACWMPLIVLWFWTPRLERVRREFDMKLPALSDWLLSGGFILLFLTIGIVLIVDALVLFYFVPGRRTRLCWSMLMIITPAAVIGLAGYALLKPMFLLIENLSR